MLFFDIQSQPLHEICADWQVSDIGFGVPLYYSVGVGAQDSVAVFANADS